jgi:hypothetical protein
MFEEGPAIARAGCRVQENPFRKTMTHGRFSPLATLQQDGYLMHVPAACEYRYPVGNGPYAANRPCGTSRPCNLRALRHAAG